MSSRLFPAGAVATADPVEWRPRSRAAGGIGYSEAPAARIEAGSPAPVLVESEVQARLDAARREGFAAGEAAGIQKAQLRLNPILASLSAITLELSGTRSRFRKDAEQATVGLAIAIARRILHREMIADPQAILGLVMAVFQKCGDRDTHRLRVSASDFQVILEHQRNLHFPASVEVVADRSLNRGSAIFETAGGELDASVDTQLSEIERGFADILQRRRPDA